MTLSLLAAGPAIATFEGSISDELTKAWSLSLLWAQAVASRSAPQGTHPWFTALSAEMGRIAWIATDADTVGYTLSGGAINTAAAASSLACTYLPPDQSGSVKTFFQAIQTGNSGDGLNSFLTTVWSSLASDGSGTAFAVSPLTISPDGQLTTTLSLLSFAAQSDEWQTFFVSRVTKATDLQSHHIRLTLNAQLWSDLVGPITNKLGQAAIASVLSLQI